MLERKKSRRFVLVAPHLQPIIGGNAAHAIGADVGSQVAGRLDRNHFAFNFGHFRLLPRRICRRDLPAEETGMRGIRPDPKGHFRS
jgi:hypothetical protein